MNLENKENLSNYQLLKRKPSLCSTSLPFSKLISVIQFFFSRDTDSDMVSIKFWRGKFSRPATGYECIAHAPAFDRGVPLTPPLHQPSTGQASNYNPRWRHQKPDLSSVPKRHNSCWRWTSLAGENGVLLTIKLIFILAMFIREIRRTTDLHMQILRCNWLSYSYSISRWNQSAASLKVWQARWLALKRIAVLLHKVKII